MVHHFRRIALAIPFLMAVATARADSITYTISDNSNTVHGEIPMFDPGLGTLFEVDFSLTGEVAGVRQDLPPGSTGIIYGTITIDALNGTTPVGGEAFNFSGPYGDGFGPNRFDIPFGGSTTWFGPPDGFYGTGMIDMHLGTPDYVPGLYHVAVTETLTYQYEPPGFVPEPSGMILVPIGLVGVMWYRRRRQ